MNGRYGVSPKRSAPVHPGSIATNVQHFLRCRSSRRRLYFSSVFSARAASPRRAPPACKPNHLSDESPHLHEQSGSCLAADGLSAYRCAGTGEPRRATQPRRHSSQSVGVRFCLCCEPGVFFFWRRPCCFWAADRTMPMSAWAWLTGDRQRAPTATTIGRPTIALPTVITGRSGSMTACSSAQGHGSMGRVASMAMLITTLTSITATTAAFHSEVSMQPPIARPAISSTSTVTRCATGADTQRSMATEDRDQ